MTRVDEEQVECQHLQLSLPDESDAAGGPPASEYRCGAPEPARNAGRDSSTDPDFWEWCRCCESNTHPEAQPLAAVSPPIAAAGDAALAPGGTGAPAPAVVCRPAYFNADYLKEPGDHYVCWLDAMGTGNNMTRSLPTCANFVCKLHVAVLDALRDFSGRPPRLYPVMDGIYITSPRKGPLLYLLSAVMRRLAQTFLDEKHVQLRFLVRGAIAYGPVVHGRDIDDKAANAIRDNPEYWNSMLLGMPMVQAYRGESLAPPFGFYVDESARAFCAEKETPFHFIWWDWYTHATPRLDIEAMWKALGEYFDWCGRFTNTTGYKVDRVREHKALAEEYFNRPRRTTVSRVGDN